MRRRETGLISGRPKLVDAMETGINIEERRRNAAGNAGTTDGDDQQVLRAAGKTAGFVFSRFRRFCSPATRGGRVSSAREVCRWLLGDSGNRWISGAERRFEYLFASFAIAV